MREQVENVHTASNVRWWATKWIDMQIRQREKDTGKDVNVVRVTADLEGSQRREPKKLLPPKKAGVI